MVDAKRVKESKSQRVKEYHIRHVARIFCGGMRISKTGTK